MMTGVVATSLGNRVASSTAALPPKSAVSLGTAPSARRAFSASVPKPLLGMGIDVAGSDDYEDDVSSEFDHSMDSFAQHSL